MSSKSRQNKPRNPVSTGASTPAEGGSGGGGVSAPPTKPADDAAAKEEVKSKLKMYMTVGLCAFVLITFVMPFAFLSVFDTSSSGDEVYAKWGNDDVGYHELRTSEFLAEKRALSQTYGALMALFGSRVGNLDDRMAASFIIYDAVAEAQGVHISEENFRDVLQELVDLRFAGDEQEFVRFLRQQHLSPKVFRENLRRISRAQRYQNMVGSVAGVPDPAQIEVAFTDQHREYSFEYVVVATEDFADAASALEPDPEEVQAWFDGLPDFERMQFQTPREVALEVVGWRVDQAPPAALLAAYPGDPEADPAVLARDYYDQVYYTRFARPEEELEAGSTDASSYYYPFEEVESVCEAEAPVYFALEAWVSDVQARQATAALEQAIGGGDDEAGEDTGEGTDASGDGAAGDEQSEGADQAGGDEEAPSDVEVADDAPEFPALVEGTTDVDLTAEANRLGLEYLPMGEPLSSEEWGELEGWSIDEMSSRFQYAEEGTLIADTFASRTSFVVVRVGAKVEPMLPEYGEIEDDVIEAWREEQRGTLAIEGLQALRDELDTEELGAELEVDEETFAAAVAAAGWELKVRDWFDRTEFPKPGDEPHEDSDHHNFLRGQMPLYDLSAGQLSEPIASWDGSNVYLVRARGSRDGDLSKITPAEYQALKSSAAREASSLFAQTMISNGDELYELYGLELITDEDEPIDVTDE